MLGTGSVLSLISLVLVIRYLDPYGARFNVVLFYLDLLVLIMSTAALAGFQLRQMFGQRERAENYFFVSLRQAVWFSVIIAGSLILQSSGLFNLLNAAILVLAFIFLESYFLYAKP